MAFPAKRFGIVLLVLLAGAIPLFATDFQLFRFTVVLAYAIALPHWLALPIAGAAYLLAGIVFALPLVRLQVVHFALVTFALAMVTPVLANYKGIERWTRGSQGLGLDRPGVPFGLPLSYDQWIFLLTLAVLLFLYALAAQAMGINATYYKALTFGISAMYAGIAGALSGLALLYVSPASIFVSLGFLIGSAVGGIATLSGAIYGAVFLELILLLTDTIAQSVKTAATLAIYGVCVIAFLHLLPGGVAGGIEKIRRSVSRGSR